MNKIIIIVLKCLFYFDSSSRQVEGLVMDANEIMPRNCAHLALYVLEAGSNCVIRVKIDRCN